MNRIIRWYNKNHGLFWVIVFIVIISIAIPRALNKHIKEQKKNGVSSSNRNITTTYDNADYSIISGGTVKKDVKEKNNTIISNFIEYCNNGDIENAYSLLSDNCKENLYPDIESFKNNYYNRVFNQKRLFEMQAWYQENGSYTYKIDLVEDMLSTGKENTMAIEDYFTIVSEKGKKRLNINDYIKREEINRQKEDDNLKINVVSKDVYLDYEIYNLEVQSKNGKTIVLDSLETTNTMYLQDEGMYKYKAFSHEITQPELQVITTRNLRVKFNKKYTTNRKINKIVFEDIILDYENYLQYDKKSEFYKREKMEISI